MKKHHIIPTFALSMLLFAACTGKPSPASENEKGETAVSMTKIPVSRDFQQINNFTDMDIEWSEGPCSVTFVGSPFELSDYDIEIDDAGLTVNLVGKAGTGSLIVTSPTLNLLSNYGNGTLRIRGTLHTDRLEIGNMQNGSMEADTLDCQSLKYTSQADATVRVAFLHADDAFILADGTGATDFNLDVGHLNVQAWGTQTITLSGRAQTKEMECSQTTTVNDQLR